MQTARFAVIILVKCVILTSLVNAGMYRNVTESKLSRQKRLLVYYPGTGLYKLVIGIGIPVELGDKRSLGMAYNFQFQYNTLRNSTDLQALYDGPITWARKRRDLELSKKQDSSRATTYKALEGLIDLQGMDGHSCLLRTICEAADTPLGHNGLVGEIMHAILTPNHYENDNEIERFDDEYSDAQTAGEKGADCQTLYPSCPMGHGILDFISMLDDFM